MTVLDRIDKECYKAQTETFHCPRVIIATPQCYEEIVKDIYTRYKSTIVNFGLTEYKGMKIYRSLDLKEDFKLY